MCFDFFFSFYAYSLDSIMDPFMEVISTGGVTLKINIKRNDERTLGFVVALTGHTSNCNFISSQT